MIVPQGTHPLFEEDGQASLFHFLDQCRLGHVPDVSLPSVLPEESRLPLIAWASHLLCALEEVEEKWKQRSLSEYLETSQTLKESIRKGIHVFVHWNYVSDSEVFGVDHLSERKHEGCKIMDGNFGSLLLIQWEQWPPVPSTLQVYSDRAVNIFDRPKMKLEWSAD